MTLTQLRYAVVISESSSMNEAAKKLFISQPSLSSSIKELEEEIGIQIFYRTNRGISTTPDGEEFIGYAKQMIEQYDLIESRYITKKSTKKKFSVSMQHYSFAVSAFVETVKKFGMDEFEFAVRETRTAEVIEDVKSLRSEIGILYLNDFNKLSLRKMFMSDSLDFHELFTCNVCVYLSKKHPLANREYLTLEDLDPYPCLSFEQGKSNSFYFSEEVLSTYGYRRFIKGNDRATMLNLMIGLNGFTLCSGIISQELNGDEYCMVPLKPEEEMTIGYLVRRGVILSDIAKQYIAELSKYK